MRALLLFVLLLPTNVCAEEPAHNGRTLTEWLNILKDDPLTRKRRAALSSIGQILTNQPDTATKAVPTLVRAMKSDSQPTVRAQAVTLLGQLSADVAGSFVNDFAEAIRNEKDTDVKRELAFAAGRFGKLSASAVLPLGELLKDASAPTRATAANALGRIGPDAQGTAAAVLPLTKDTDRAVRVAAVFALGRIDPRDSDLAAEAILEALAVEAQPNKSTTRDTELVTTALISLGLLGEKSPEVVKAVAKYLADKHEEIRQLAAITLGKFGVVARIAGTELQTSFERDADKLVRQYALRALCRATHDPNATMPSESLTKLIGTLGERLKADPDFEVRIAIAEELGSFGQLGKAGIPALQEARRDSQLKVREAAANAIRQIEKPLPKPKP